MANILLVGTATLDIVYTLDHYPREDEEMRAQSLRMCRGGNAANTAVVLSRLGHACTFAGVLADAPETAVIVQDFARHGVDCSAAQRLPGRPPTSSIYLSEGRRTIVHYRDLPELRFEDFLAIDLTPFDWLHFEGRNVPELLKMLCRVRELHPGIPLSLEIEKPRAGIEALLSFPSLLIFSRAYAQARGFSQPFAFLQALAAQSPQADMVVGWGEAGTYALGQDGAEFHSPAFPPPQIIDTLGAGDTFNAGLIDAHLRGADRQDMLEAACRLAGRKCGMMGFGLEPVSHI
ncbi:MAG: ketohexokinase [Nitrosomonadales bacterium]|nr:MAG: ketohexokinase [Nitrosomonadales bacterium]